GCEDAGAVSAQQITTSTGYLEFTLGEASLARYVGLNRGSTGTSAGEIDFAISIQWGNAEVRESGVYRADTPVVAGDRLRVAVEAGVVKYYKNGTVFYTSAVAPSYPLQADTSLLNSGSAVTNAVISY